MRLLMGIIKDRHGTYYARKKVPKNLESAVAKITDAGKPRVSWLTVSLRTKDRKQANTDAKAHLARFDRILAAAAAAIAERPLRTSLTQREMERMAAYHYAIALQADDVRRTGGFSLPQFQEEQANTAELLHECRLALARGQIETIAGFLSELLDLSKIHLDPNCEDYRRLGMMVLAQEVEALEALAKRNEGRVIPTPKVQKPDQAAPASGVEGATLTAAFKGWTKAQSPSPYSLREYQHAIDRFVELHGDMAVVALRRSHVLQFREALQDIPVRRAGKLRTATLPELVEWRKANPDATHIAAGTVNKLLGGVQAVANWARNNGLIADDVAWADPFADMRLEEDEPDREPWETEDLVKLMASPVFAKGEKPKAGGGEAAYWLPLLGMFTGARLGELAPLRVPDVEEDAESGVRFLAIREDEEGGKRVKTTSSIRTVPIHPELIRLGFLNYVAKAAKRGANALLFPELRPGPKGGMAEGWSKWFGRYNRANGIAKPVFHSFRHSFKDALRAAKVSEDMNDALTGHSGGGTGRRYGAKDMLRRYGAEALADAVAKVQYPKVRLPST